MSKQTSIRILSIVVLLVSVACAVTGTPPTATPTLDLPATQKAEAALTETQQAVDQANQQATEAAQGTADAQSTADAQATADAVATADQATAIAKSTAEYVAQVTGTAQAAETQRAKKTEAAAAASATSVASATARASSMFDLVLSLKDQGIIDTTDGKYYRLPDFNEMWAQLGWYMYWPTGYSPTNFVLRTNAAWESASTTAEWDSSGCGFVFWYTKESHQPVFFTMDGYVHYGRSKAYYGKLNTPNPDTAILTLVVQNKRMTFFVNDSTVVF